MHCKESVVQIMIQVEVIGQTFKLKTSNLWPISIRV